MLHRSFKPAKCKTALKLAVSRIKLLKNKRASHMMQLRQEVAQLLESGNERTARIRVEHVVREEKTMAAYDLLEVYCELIVARLPMIESQKNCPIDLKEAVTSVIFASPRCSDLPELQDVRKHFQSKYGKEFTTAALELRPGCGVSRLMIEKLSVAAPDVQTKTKILSAIALEHNIDWDSKTSGENEEKPPEDLLHGPSSFLRASQTIEETHVQTPTNDTQKHDPYLNRNPSSSPVSQNLGSSSMPSTSQPQLGTPNARPEETETEHRYSYSGDQKAFDAGNQNWNMEFTDATSAAQAAAEAAERASMAARAAAQLSSGERISRQHSSDIKRSPDTKNGSIGKQTVSTISNVIDPETIQKHGGHPRMQTDKISAKNSGQSNAHPDAVYQNEGLETFSGKSQMPSNRVLGNDGQGTCNNLDSTLRSDHLDTDSKRNSHDSFRVQGINVNEQGNQTRVNEQLNRHVHVRGSSRSDSLKSGETFHEDEMFLKRSGQEDIYPHSGISVQCDTTIDEPDLEMRTSNYTSTEAEHVNYFADEILHEQSTNSISKFHSTKFEDDHDDLKPDEPDEMDHVKFQPHGSETVVFDNSGSDDDVDYKFNITGGFKDDYPDPFRSPDLPIYESPKRSYLFASDTRRVSYEESVPKAIFPDSESSLTKLSGDRLEIAGSSHSHESLPLVFDQSDSDGELDGSDLVDSSAHEASGGHTDFGTESIDEVTTFPIFDDDKVRQYIPSSSHSFVSERESKPARHSTYMRDEKSTEQPSLDTGKELNLGILSGGLRNKGKKHPYFVNSRLDDVPSLPTDDISVNDNLLSGHTRTFADFESSARHRLGGQQESRRTDKKSNPKLKFTHFDSEDCSDSEDELPQISINGQNQERHSQNTSAVVSHKSSFNSRSTYSDNDNFQNDEGTMMQVSRSKPDFGSSPAVNHKSNFSSLPINSDNDSLQNEEGLPRPKPHLSSGLSRRTKTSTSDGQRKPSREKYGAASSSLMETQTTNRDKQSDEPRLTKPVPQKSVPLVKRHADKLSSTNKQLDSNVSTVPSTGTSGPSNPKAEKSTTRQDSGKKASHVHPKLPDIDTLAALMDSLRTSGK